MKKESYNIKYYCSECDKEYWKGDYRLNRGLFCPICSDRLERDMSDINPIRASHNSYKKEHSQSDQKSLMAECPSCKKSISVRATICPKCGVKPAQECLICNNLIPSQALNCPECGDPSPFKSTDSNKEAGEEYKLEASGDKNTLKTILIVIPCFIFYALFVSVVNELMEPGLLKLLIVLLGLYLTFKIWDFLKNRLS